MAQSTAEPGRVYTVQFPFTAEGEGEISVEEGHVLVALPRDDEDGQSGEPDGWARVQSLSDASKVGFVPVEFLAPTEQLIGSTSEAPQLPESAGNGAAEWSGAGAEQSAGPSTAGTGGEAAAAPAGGHSTATPLSPPGAGSDSGGLGVSGPDSPGQQGGASSLGASGAGAGLSRSQLGSAGPAGEARAGAGGGLGGSGIGSGFGMSPGASGLVPHSAVPSRGAAPGQPSSSSLALVGGGALVPSRADPSAQLEAMHSDEFAHLFESHDEWFKQAMQKRSATYRQLQSSVAELGQRLSDGERKAGALVGRIGELEGIIEEERSRWSKRLEQEREGLQAARALAGQGQGQGVSAGKA